MAESTIFPVFGIKAVELINRNSGVPYGRYRVLGGAELSVSADKVPLMGGAQRWSWATEWGAYDAEITMTVREYPEFGFRQIAQGSSVISTAETTGNVGSITNKTGTSVSGTNNITSVEVITDSQAALKTGRFVLEAVGTGTFDVYYIGSDYDSYESDTLKITAAPLQLAIEAGSTTLAAWGLVFSTGTGSTSMTVSDTAQFDVREVNTGAEVIDVGKASETVQEFEAWILSEDQKNGNQFYVHIPKCSASGLPINFTEKEHSEAEITLSIDYSSTLDYAYRVIKILG